MVSVASRRALRNALDTMASVCTIAVAIAALTVVYRGGLAGRAATAPAPQTAARPEPPLPTKPLSLAGAQTQGSADATVAMIEFSDFECPYCSRFARETLPALQKEFVESGRVLIAFRHLPIERIHANAVGAAVAAECAGAQGQFWTAHDYLFAHPDRLAKDSIVAAADSWAIDRTAFIACLNAASSVEAVRAHSAGAQELQVTGTPTFFLGAMGKDRTVKVALRLSGAQPLEAFRSALSKLLSQAG